MARLGPHDSHRHQSVLPDRLESRIVSQDTDEHIQKPRTFIRREPQGDLGDTGVLSRVQSREWWSCARIRSLRRTALIGFVRRIRVEADRGGIDRNEHQARYIEEPSGTDRHVAGRLSCARPSTRHQFAFGVDCDHSAFKEEHGLEPQDIHWRTGGQEAEIIATTIPPSNDLESAIVLTLTSGAYTAIVRGKDDTTGVGLVEVYQIN